MLAPGDPIFRVITTQTTRADGSMAAPGIPFIIRKAMSGAPDTNTLWDRGLAMRHYQTLDVLD